MRCVVHVRFSKNESILHNLFLKFWRHNVVADKGDNITTCFRAIDSGVSTGFIWLCRETFRWYYCTGKNHDSKDFLHNLNSSVSLYIPMILANTLLLLRSRGRHNAETNHCWFIINFMKTGSENLRRLPTVKTARTLHLCWVFGYCMVYS